MVKYGKRVTTNIGSETQTSMQNTSECDKMNPVKAGLAEHPEEYPYSSARLKGEVDPAPHQFQQKPRG